MKRRETVLDAVLIAVGLLIVVYGLMFAEPNAPFILDPWGVAFPR